MIKIKVIKPNNTTEYLSGSTYSWYDPIFNEPGWYSIDGKLKYINNNRLLAYQIEDTDIFFCYLTQQKMSKIEVEKLLI